MSEPTPPPLSDEDARRQRHEALSALAKTQLGIPITPDPSSIPNEPRAPQRRFTLGARTRTTRRPPWLVIVSVALIIVVVAGIVLHQLGIFRGQSAKGPAVPSIVVIAPSVQELACLKDAAWSPNGQEVAVLGYSDQCPQDFPSSYNYEPGVLQLYSATTGKLVRTILPDATVFALPGAPTPGTVQPESAGDDTSKTVLDYRNILWSPDGKQLALAFYITRWSTNGASILPGFDGLILVNADGTNERAALFRETDQTFGYALRCDTTALHAVTLPPQASYANFASLPVASSYMWSSSGQLVPGSPLTISPSLTSPIGNPDGDRSFTIWQPGSIVLSTQADVNNQTVSVNPGIYSWSTGALAWSPDGQYLIDSFSLLGILHPAGAPSATAAGLKALGWEGAPNVPVRDPALQGLLASLSANASHGEQLQDDIAWSPSGQILAAIPEESNGSNSSSTTSGKPASVTFYDSTTGKSLGTLEPNSQVSSTPIIGSSSFLRWSPNGSHVLLFSAQLGTVTLWGPSMLPHIASG